MDEKGIEVRVSMRSKDVNADSLVPMTAEGHMVKKRVELDADEVEDESATLGQELRALRL